MMYGVVQGLVEVCGYFELLFVNVLGMPYNSGVFAYVFVTVGVLIWAIWETMREEIHSTRMKIAFILSVVLIGMMLFQWAPKAVELKQKFMAKFMKSKVKEVQ